MYYHPQTDSYFNNQPEKKIIFSFLLSYKFIQTTLLFFIIRICKKIPQKTDKPSLGVILIDY